MLHRALRSRESSKGMCLLSSVFRSLFCAQYLLFVGSIGFCPFNSTERMHFHPSPLHHKTYFPSSNGTSLWRPSNRRRAHQHDRTLSILLAVFLLFTTWLLLCEMMFAYCPIEPINRAFRPFSLNPPQAVATIRSHALTLPWQQPQRMHKPPQDYTRRVLTTCIWHDCHCDRIVTHQWIFCWFDVRGWIGWLEKWRIDLSSERLFLMLQNCQEITTTPCDLAKE
jgi:hypothetical protein